MLMLPEVIIEALGSDVPVWNSAAAPDAVRLISEGELAVVGAELMTNDVPLVTELTVVLLASPVPDSAIPITSPAVLSQMTDVEELVVRQFLSTTPQAVRERLEPVASEGCEMVKLVPLLMAAMVVLSVELPVMLPEMFGPVNSIPGHSKEVLSH